VSGRRTPDASATRGEFTSLFPDVHRGGDEMADHERMDERFEWLQESDGMVAFALRWAPFGGGDADEILTEFGLTERVFFLRLRHLLVDPASHGLDEVTAERLQRICADRLRPGDAGPQPTDRLPA
jgi:hypothetical protein